MGWFDSQIRERISNNKQQLQKAYWNLASVVMKESNETFADTQSTGNQNALANGGKIVMDQSWQKEKMDR